MGKKLISLVIIGILIFAVITLIYHKSQQADINYYQGHMLFEKGEYDKAIKFYKKVLNLNPSYTDALEDLAYSYQWTNRYEEAIDTFQRCLSINPKDNKLKLSLARTYSWIKEYEKAISLCEEVVEATGSIDAKRQLAEICIWNNQPDKAKSILEEILEETPSDAKAKLLFARAMQYSGEAEKAVGVYEELLKERKEEEEKEEEEEEMEKEVKKLLTEAYMISKDYDKAIQQCREILKEEPQNVEVRIALADILSWNEKYDEAIIEYRKTLKIEPDNLLAKEKLAKVLTWKEDYKEAENLYKDIIRENPENMDAYISLARILTWNKRYTEALRYFDIALSKEEDDSLLLLYAQTLLFSGDYIQAKEILNEIVSESPSNMEAKVYLADAFASSKEFDKAISLYKEILDEKEDPEIKQKLADVLSWNKKYGKAIGLYDEILDEKEDKKVRLQKARVLGWAREYEESIKEYKKILEIAYDDKIALELRTKKAYWDGRVKHAITYYNELIGKEPDNVEAMFDLSQIYSYQSMWEEAIKEYERILKVSPEHFRAREGLQKAELISSHILFKAGYEFFKAKSSSRDSDIRRYSSFYKLSLPVNNNLRIDAEHSLTYRNFTDITDVLENESKINVLYINNPDWWVDSFYSVFAYSDDIETMQNFGGDISFRIFDMGKSQFSYKRERLENNSAVIKKHRYRDSFKERIDIDINKYLKAGADYLFSYYSDDNYKHEPAYDMLYYLSLDPMRFSIKYRYFYRAFDERKDEYFSPKRFTTNKVIFNWRHFLNKEEIFFGADDLYYDLKYELSVDSKDIVGHKFSSELNWDINKKLNFNIEGSVTNTSAGVYDDRNLVASIKYYF